MRCVISQQCLLGMFSYGVSTHHLRGRNKLQQKKHHSGISHSVGVGYACKICLFLFWQTGLKTLNPIFIWTGHGRPQKHRLELSDLTVTAASPVACKKPDELADMSLTGDTRASLYLLLMKPESTFSGWPKVKELIARVRVKPKGSIVAALHFHARSRPSSFMFAIVSVPFL